MNEKQDPRENQQQGEIKPALPAGQAEPSKIVEVARIDGFLDVDDHNVTNPNIQGR